MNKTEIFYALVISLFVSSALSQAQCPPDGFVCDQRFYNNVRNTLIKHSVNAVEDMFKLDVSPSEFGFHIFTIEKDEFQNANLWHRCISNLGYSPQKGITGSVTEYQNFASLIEPGSTGNVEGVSSVSIVQNNQEYVYVFYRKANSNEIKVKVCTYDPVTPKLDWTTCQVKAFDSFGPTSRIDATTFVDNPVASNLIYVSWDSGYETYYASLSISNPLNPTWSATELVTNGSSDERHFIGKWPSITASGDQGNPRIHIAFNRIDTVRIDSINNLVNMNYVRTRWDNGYWAATEKPVAWDVNNQAMPPVIHAFGGKVFIAQGVRKTNDATCRLFLKNQSSDGSDIIWGSDNFNQVNQPTVNVSIAKYLPAFYHHPLFSPDLKIAFLNEQNHVSDLTICTYKMEPGQGVSWSSPCNLTPNCPIQLQSYPRVPIIATNSMAKCVFYREPFFDQTANIVFVREENGYSGFPPYSMLVNVHTCPK